MNTEITKEQAIARGIEILKGRDVEAGAVVGIKSDEFTHEFLRYEGEEAIVRAKEGTEKRWPKSEMFDARKLLNVANHILNFGWWKEGQESFVVTLSTQ